MKIYLVRISQQEYFEMRLLGFIKDGYEKNYVVLNKQKNSKAKTYVICEPDYKEYKKYL